MENPFISIIVCSFNKPQLLRKCLLSIYRQNYPKTHYEVIIVDGGCTKDDAFPTIVASTILFNNFKRIDNPKSLPEGKGKGKWLGYRHISQKAKYVAFIDQDNEIQGTDWLRRMIEPLERNENAVGSHSRLLLEPSDALINRYTALIGTDPFAAYRSIDGYLGFMGRRYSKEDYMVLDNNPKNLMITGGNAFIYRRSELDAIGGYTQDTDNIALMAKKLPGSRIIIPDAWTHHHAFSSVGDFIRKKMLWGKQPQSKVFKWIPEDWPGRLRLAAHILANITIIPNVYISVKNTIRDKESAWLLHAPLAFITTVIYGINFIRNFVTEKL